MMRARARSPGRGAMSAGWQTDAAISGHHPRIFFVQWIDNHFIHISLEIESNLVDPAINIHVADVIGPAVTESIRSHLVFDFLEFFNHNFFEIFHITTPDF